MRSATRIEEDHIRGSVEPDDQHRREVDRHDWRATLLAAT